MKKLKYVNNWEYDEYYVGKTQVNDLKRVMINNFEFEVKAKTVTVEYSDMGTPGSATSVHFFIVGMMGGIGFERDLNTLVRNMDVYAVEWS